MSDTPLPDSVQRVAAALAAAGHADGPVWLDSAARTRFDEAAAKGVP